MQVELRGREASIIGARNPIVDCIAASLEANGARTTWIEGTGQLSTSPDILVVSHDLTTAEPRTSTGLLEQSEILRGGMAEHQPNRIIHLISALGVVAMRRHQALSVTAAAIAAFVRIQAMRLAPQVLVNAVAIGAIGEGDKLVSGDAAMLSHVPDGRLGSALDVAHAVLFLVDPVNTYTTGQILAVDGGWTAGYGRNF